MVVENNGLNRYWNDLGESIAQNSSNFDDYYLEYGEDNLGEGTLNRIEESWIGEEEISASEAGKETR
jgi:hypothetical protein